MKPWTMCLNINSLEDEAAEEAAWKNVAGKDFYFALDDGEDGPYVVITPREYFDQEGCWYDQHLDIDHIIPGYLCCLQEGMYDWPDDVHPNKVKNTLKKKGFIENPDLVKS